MVADTTVHIVALSSLGRAEQARACYAIGHHAEIYSNYDELVAAAPRSGLILAEDIAERGGVVRLIASMAERSFWLPVIATAEIAAAERVVEAVKGGALDYLTLPLDPGRLAAALSRAEQGAREMGQVQRQALRAQAKLDRLTVRESEVLDLLVGGASNKAIARALEISPRTVEIHRANMMAKLDARHAADAVRLRLEAAMGPQSGSLPPARRWSGA